MSYKLAVIGVNHKTSSLELRERIYFNSLQAERFLNKLKTFYPEQEFVIVSTCNRIEIYIGSLKEEPADLEKIISLWAAYHNLTAEDISPLIYTYFTEYAVKHLFEVASGIDSLVIGETQILGQVKDSYQKALALKVTGKVLNSAFQKAFAVGKKVRTQTKIGEGNVSISSISCQLAEEVLGGFSGKKVLLIGAGKIGTLTLSSLCNKGIDTILVSSRNYGKARNLAKKFKGQPIKFAKIEAFMTEADVVISSTSAPHHVLSVGMLKKVMFKRKKKPIFLIDLAVPRDIEPEVGRLSGVHLYNIDYLKKIAEENRKKRVNEILKSSEIITREIDFLKASSMREISDQDKVLKNMELVYAKA